MTFYDYIISKVGKTSVTIEDGESIDEADDYKSLIDDLFLLTNGGLNLESFVVEEYGSSASIEITVSGTKHNLKLEVSGWINNDFIEEINKICNEKSLNSRFYQFWAGDTFGQEVGYFFAPIKLSDEIFEYSRIKNEKATDYGELYMIGDGNREEGYNVEL